MLPRDFQADVTIPKQNSEEQSTQHDLKTGVESMPGWGTGQQSCPTPEPPQGLCQIKFPLWKGSFVDKFGRDECRAGGRGGCGVVPMHRLRFLGRRQNSIGKPVPGKGWTLHPRAHPDSRRAWRHSAHPAPSPEHSQHSKLTEIHPSTLWHSGILHILCCSSKATRTFFIYSLPPGNWFHDWTLHGSIIKTEIRDKTAQFSGFQYKGWKHKSWKPWPPPETPSAEGRVSISTQAPQFQHRNSFCSGGAVLTQPTGNSQTSPAAGRYHWWDVESPGREHHLR